MIQILDIPGPEEQVWLQVWPQADVQLPPHSIAQVKLQLAEQYAEQLPQVSTVIGLLIILFWILL